MKDVCVLARDGDLFSLMLIKELRDLSLRFDVCWLTSPPKKKKLRRGRFIGMSMWSCVFWKDYFRHVAFGHSKIQQEIIKEYVPIMQMQSSDRVVFEDLGQCREYLYNNNYKYVLIGGIPILSKSFFERSDMMFIGCHPAPLPEVRGEDHLVFTLYYGLYPSASVYQLNHRIDGGNIFEVVPLSTLTPNDSFYSIMQKLEVHRAKTLARFIQKLLSGSFFDTVPNDGKLHQYKDVTNQIRKTAEENLKKLFS